KDFTYMCTYSSNPGNRVTDTRMATWDSSTYNTPDRSQTGQANAEFTSTNPTIKDGSVNVTDSLGGAMDTASYIDPSNPKACTYNKKFSGAKAGTGTKQDNPAKVTTSDTSTTDSASQSVQVCVGADLTVKKDAASSFTRTYK